MMWRLSWAIVGAVLVAGIPATASDHANGKLMTIRLISTEGPGGVVKDVPPRTLDRGVFSRGDKVTGTSILRNDVAQLGKPKGARVGTDRYVITANAPPKVLINVVVTLPGGTIRARGERLFKDPIVISVIGGTGAFAGARGTSEARSLSGGRTLNVYRLRVP